MILKKEKKNPHNTGIKKQTLNHWSGTELSSNLRLCRQLPDPTGARPLLPQTSSEVQDTVYFPNILEGQARW